MVKVKTLPFWWMPFLLRLCLDYSGSKGVAVKNLYYTVKWDMPFAWCNFCFCSPLSMQQLINWPKSNFTVLAAPPFHCTLQSRCPCAAAAGQANTFVRCTLGPKVSTLTERWVVFLSTCFLGKIWPFLPPRNLSHSQCVLNLSLLSCKKIWGLFDLIQT